MIDRAVLFQLKKMSENHGKRIMQEAPLCYARESYLLGRGVQGGASYALCAFCDFRAFFNSKIVNF